MNRTPTLPSLLRKSKSHRASAARQEEKFGVAATVRMPTRKTREFMELAGKLKLAIHDSWATDHDQTRHMRVQFWRERDVDRSGSLYEIIKEERVRLS